jgi:hypothetical protein
MNLQTIHGDLLDQDVGKIKGSGVFVLDRRGAEG